MTDEKASVADTPDEDPRQNATDEVEELRERVEELEEELDALRSRVDVIGECAARADKNRELIESLQQVVDLGFVNPGDEGNRWG